MGRSVGIDREPQGSGKPPSPKRKLWWSQARLGFFSRGCMRAYLMGTTPETLGDPRGVGRGVFFVWEALDLRLSIPIC